MRKTAFLSFILVIMISSVAAPCPVVYTPPNSFVHLTSESQGLVAYEEETNTQRYVVRQAYEGVASDFGLVLPTPGKPNMTSREEGLFKELHKMTKEPVDRKNSMFSGSLASQNMESSVEVVESRDIGDFNATILRADDSEALTDWLTENGFNYGSQSTENFEYYIEKDREYYFTAMKINVEEADCLSRSEFQFGKGIGFRNQIAPQENVSEQRCWLRGGLQPVEFTFETDKPMLPLRIMSRPHDSSPMTSNKEDGHNHTHSDSSLPPGNFLVYTLADRPLTVPGAKVKYSDKVSDLPEQLESYDAKGDFLVRQRIKFNAHEVEEDLYFKKAKPFHVPREDTRIVNPSQLNTENGMMKFSGQKQKVEFTEKASAFNDLSYYAQKNLVNDISRFAAFHAYLF